MNKQNITLEEIERQLKLSQKSERSFFSLLAGFIKTLLQIAILPAIVYLVFAFFLGIAQVEQSSMVPNFAEGDIVVFNRLEKDYGFGDVIIAQSIEKQSLIIKRIIGTPGDTIEITDNQQILINGEPIRESWQSNGKLAQGRASLPITLKEGEYFVLGDNYEVSLDSRHTEIGNVQEENILGIVVYRFKMSK
ncbi:MAG: signal peptidase I [Erysipelotrichaceae bacterium]|nr:signal peptidase I [Erysipelotrichaceae bacterium]